MSAPPGWYPDPGGSDSFRYFDGATWSALTSPTPAAAPPTTTTPPVPTRPSRSRTPWPWLIGLAAVVLVVVVIGVVAVRQVTGGNAFGGGNPQRSQDSCPPAASASSSPAARPNDGRVHGGRLSYPRLGTPWDNPDTDSRVPFGRDIQQQFVTIERGEFLGFDRWGADVLVGELVAGDGFFAPRDGVEIVLRCAMGVFYGDTEVGRDDQRSAAITIDGRQGWVTETELSFTVPNLQAKREHLTVAVVDIGDGTAGLFLSSVPENGPQYLPQARTALADLRVDD